MKHTISFLSGLLIFSCNLFAQSPGGIAKYSVWLKGNFSSDSSRLAYLNYNPAMTLDNSVAPISLSDKVESLRKVTIFTVYTDSARIKEKNVWSINGKFGDLSLSTGQILSETGKTNLSFEKKIQKYRTARSEAIINTYTSHNDEESRSGNTEFKEATINFGNSPGSENSPLKMISEFLLYERVLTEEEINQVETYLAIKYGITLEENYHNSLGEAVWSRNDDNGYSNNIAGIARDDQATLDQKQSRSSTCPELLEIGVNKISESNNKNRGQMNDGDYLIWGDNAESFKLRQDTEAGADDILISEKKWLMKASGNTANRIPTELKIDISTFLPGKLSKTSIYLMIKRFGSDFGSEDCVYISPDNITEEGIATFSNIYWDTDGSGNDLFTFGFKPGGILRTRSLVKETNGDINVGLTSFQVYPNPVSDGNYQVAVNLQKPGDICIQICDLAGKIIHTTKKSGKASYLIPGRITQAAGSYVVKLLTADAEFYRILVIQ
jgi:hypothetical protein